MNDKYIQVKIQNGLIKGIWEEGVLAFKGIPFAQPPVGERRFKAPQPCEDWEGVLDCTIYGPRPIQTPPPWCLDKEQAVYDEDCLNLNIWTPAADGAKRPVIFNIFGGGFMEGSNSEAGSEGFRLIQGREVVFAAPNYRVGALGALYLEEIFGKEYEDSGNLTLLDQILALKWVRDNIDRFGGDPEHITIVGQSAGGKSVLQLMLAKEAAGLFHGAVAMSGTLQGVKDKETMSRFAGLFLKELGIRAGETHKLQEVTAKEILEAQERLNRIYFKAETYGATADGIHLPTDVEKAVREGGLADVPLIMGHTMEELYFDPRQEYQDIGEEAVRQKLRWKYGNNAEPVYRFYEQLRRTEDYPESWGKTATEYTYRQAYMRMAALLSEKGRKFWLYRWDYRGGLRANHSSDNEALFGRTNPDKIAWKPDVTASVDRFFREAILHFAECTDPCFEDGAEWRPYTAQERERLLVDETCRIEKMDPVYDTAFPLQVFSLRKADWHGKHSILVLCDDYWHPGEVIKAGMKPLEERFEITYIADAKDMLTLDFIEQYDVIVCCKGNSINGANQAPWFEENVTEVMPEDFEKYVRQGKGFLCIHAGNTAREGTGMAPFLGSYFVGHPPRCQIEVKLGKHSITEGIEDFTVRDEHYRIELTSGDAEVFCQTYSQQGGEQTGGYTREIGKGRLCVLTPGHILEVWRNREYLKLLENALEWCAFMR